MDSQDSSTGCIVTHGGFSRAQARSSDSLKLRSELPCLLEPPPKPARFPLKKLSQRLIARRGAGKACRLQKKTEAGIRKADESRNSCGSDFNPRGVPA